MLGERFKNVLDILWYTFDWSLWLGSDTIATSVWSLPAGVTLQAQSNTTTKANVKISGGTTATSYTIKNTITTTTGLETKEETFLLRIN